MPASNLSKRVTSLLVPILIGYALVLAFIRIFESRLIFFPNYPSRLAGDWNPRGLAVQDVWLTSEDGTKPHAWWIPNEAAKFTFLAFHGNAGNIADRAIVYEFLRDTPANVLALEYRGYGRTNLAARHQVGGVVLEAPFLSASRAARRIFWFLPGISLLVHSQFDTEERLKEISAPIFVVHCNQDPVLPFQFGQEVCNAARPPKHFLEINGYCHEEASVIAPAQYRSALRKFLVDIENRENNDRPEENRKAH